MATPDWFQIIFTLEDVEQNKHLAFVNDFAKCKENIVATKQIALFFRDYPESSKRVCYFPQIVEEFCLNVVTNYKADRAQKPMAVPLSIEIGNWSDYNFWFGE